MPNQFQSMVYLFDFDLDTQEFFTGGGCFDLAYTLSERWGLPAKSVCASDLPIFLPTHAVVQIADDLYLDILGIWTEAELLEYWREYDLEISWRNARYTYTLEAHKETDYEHVKPAYMQSIIEQIISKLKAYPEIIALNLH